MQVNKPSNISELLKANAYPGRGIIIGKSQDGEKAVVAYFIMGRSANSRNRVLTEKNGELFTEPFDASKTEDPSLIIYAAIKRTRDKIVVSNGDQTETVYNGLKNGVGFTDSLNTRTFEPDAPNFTPRISGLIEFKEGDFDYTLSILKSGDAAGKTCDRYFFEYQAAAGQGRFIHTYDSDGNPLPSFTGEPRKVLIPDDIDEFSDKLWNALDEDNKISLYVEYIDLKTEKSEKRLFNKNS